MSTFDWSSMITVGRIVRPQHNRGQVVVVTETDFPQDRFAPGAVLYRETATGVSPLTVREGRPQDARWIVGFEGVESIDAAETLRGVELRVPAESLAKLGPGAYYVHDLVGCVVATSRGQVVGQVGRVDVGSGIPMLVVQAEDGEVLVPFAEAFVRHVDMDSRRIEIDPPEGLLELNRPRQR